MELNLVNYIRIDLASPLESPIVMEEDLKRGCFKMKERVKVYYKNKPSEDVKIVYACEDPKEDDEVIFKLHGYFYSYFIRSSNFYVNDKRLFEGGKNQVWDILPSDFDYMPLPCGHSSFKDFVEGDDDMKYIWDKPKCVTAMKKNEESRKPDLIDAIIEGAKKMEEFEEKNTPCDPSSDPTHPSHYAQGGVSVWDVIRAYTDELNGVDALSHISALTLLQSRLFEAKEEVKEECNND